MIDPHVHCRDWNEKQKETIEHALIVAENIGLDAIFDMPNTNPEITTKERVKERLELAKSTNSKVFYGLHIGLTSDPIQIKNAVEIYYNEPQVVGLKLFAGKSVGNLEVIDEKKQQLIYDTLSKLKDDGVLVVHCEKEGDMINELWDPKNPISHCYARPPIAEINSVIDQIKFAKDNNFKGHLHIAHVSVPESVDLIKKARNFLDISCGVTPHHILLNHDYMLKENGIMYKMNPPLRCDAFSSILIEYLKEGLIDNLESDHAPHTIKDKIDKYMSGIPNLPFWPVIINELKTNYDFTEQKIKEINHDNIINIYSKKDIKINNRELINNGIEKLYGFYCFNPYEKIKLT